MPSASLLSHLESPCLPAFLRYSLFSCGVQRNSTRAVDGFLIGGLPRERLGSVIAAIVRTEIIVDKGIEDIYSVRTLNEEAQMPKKSRRQELAEFVANGKLRTALRRRVLP
jgi:hypothetical protein